jgi:hypothetical protein
MSEPRLHVTFDSTSADSIREALAACGRGDEEIVFSLDGFNFGPIEPDDAHTRSRWLDTELGPFDHDQYATVAPSSEPVLQASLAARQAPIVWLSRSDAHSVAGFLWWLSHIGKQDVLLIEASAFPLVPPAEIPAFFGKERALPDAERAEHIARWGRLKAENAPLRILTEDGLVSAPIEVFDASLLKHVRPEWRKMARVIGGFLGYQTEEPFWQTGDFVLASRLRTLAKAGAVEWQGNLNDIRHGEVRLKS